MKFIKTIICYILFIKVHFCAYSTFPLGLDIDERIVRPSLAYSKVIYSLKNKTEPHVIIGRDRGVLGKIWNDLDNVFIVFKGSSTASDWVRNLQCGLSEEGIHKGFDLIVNSAIIQVSRILSSDEFKEKSLIFTGHSLGGAIASLMAYRIAEKGSTSLDISNRIKVLAFCAPKLCNRMFATRVNRLLGEQNILCFGDDCDLVPHQSFASTEFARPGLFLGISSRVLDTIDVLHSSRSAKQMLFSMAKSIVLSTHQIPNVSSVLSSISREKDRRSVIAGKLSHFTPPTDFTTQTPPDDEVEEDRPDLVTTFASGAEKFQYVLQSVQSKIDELSSSLRDSFGSSMPRVVLIGNTRVGKSTILDLLLERDIVSSWARGQSFLTTPSDSKVDMTVHSGRRTKELQTDAGIIFTNESTEEPAVVTADSFMYFDMPGFLDRRGIERELLNTYFYKYVFDSPNDTKVLYVINYNILTASFGDGRDFLVQLNALQNLFVGEDWSVNSSVHFIINRVDQRCDTMDVYDLMRDIAKNRVFSKEYKSTQDLLTNMLDMKTPFFSILKDGETSLNLTEVVQGEAFSRFTVDESILSKSTRKFVSQYFESILQAYVQEYIGSISVGSGSQELIDAYKRISTSGLLRHLDAKETGLLEEMYPSIYKNLRDLFVSNFDIQQERMRNFFLHLAHKTFINELRHKSLAEFSHYKEKLLNTRMGEQFTLGEYLQRLKDLESGYSFFIQKGFNRAEICHIFERCHSNFDILIDKIKNIDKLGIAELNGITVYSLLQLTDDDIATITQDKVQQDIIKEAIIEVKKMQNLHADFTNEAEEEQESFLEYVSNTVCEFWDTYGDRIINIGGQIISTLILSRFGITL